MENCINKIIWSQLFLNMLYMIISCSTSYQSPLDWLGESPSLLPPSSSVGRTVLAEKKSMKFQRRTYNSQRIQTHSLNVKEWKTPLFTFRVVPHMALQTGWWLFHSFRGVSLQDIVKNHSKRCKLEKELSLYGSSKSAFHSFTLREHSETDYKNLIYIDTSRCNVSDNMQL